MTTKSRQKTKTQSDQASPRKAARLSEIGNLRRRAISIFILFHLIAITCWAIPLDFLPVQVVKQLVRPYMVWTGLFQSWDTFAPNPKSTNTYIKAVVITKNRHMHVWTFPRMEELSFGERYRKERYRKFAEVLPAPGNAALWPDVANHIARSYNGPDSAYKVILIQFQSDINPAADNSSDPVAKPNVFYEAYSQPGDCE